MRKVTDFIVNKSKLILIIFLLLSVFCIYLMSKVTINSELSPLVEIFISFLLLSILKYKR